MEWAKRHPRLYKAGKWGGVAMLVYGGIVTVWQSITSEPLIPYIVAKFSQLPTIVPINWSLATAIIPLVIGVILLVAILRVSRRQPSLLSEEKEKQKQEQITKIPSRREALETAKIAWGLWHTGHRNRIDRLLSIESLSRVLILNPNADAEEIGVVARRSGETIESLIIQIQDTTRDALKHNKQVRWYPQHRESSFTIVDTTPIEEDGILKPRSDNAWMYVEYLNPDVGVDQRQGGPIYNRGKDKPRFIGFFQEYEYIWNKESIPAKQESNSQTKELKAEPHLELFGLPYTRKKLVSGFGEPSFCLVQFCNKPYIRSPEANAPKVFATTTFYDMAGVRLLELDRVRPAGIPQPTSQDPRVSLREEYYAVDFSANGSPWEYTIAYKYDSDDFCYAFDDLVYYSNWRKREYELPGDSYYVRFHLSGENTKGTWWFILRNYHQHKEPTLEVVPEPDFYKKGSQI